MNRQERLWIAGYGLVLVLLTAVPFLLAAGAAAGEWVFSGHVIGVEDGHSYIAKMLRGASGDWLFRTPYTTAPQQGAPVFLPYLLLGKLFGAGASHDQLLVAFHALRSLGVFVAVLGSYRFAAHFLSGRSQRRWVTVMATLGGGLGWLLLLLGGGGPWDEIPLVFISPETFGFLGALTAPHLVLARGLMLLTLVAYLEAIDTGVGSTRGSFLLLLTAVVHPVASVLVYVVIAAHQLARLGRASAGRNWEPWRSGLRPALVILIPTAPYLLYLAVLGWTDPFLAEWSAQNLIRSPHPGYYLLAYGLLLPWVALGIRTALRQATGQRLLLVAWALLLPALAYAPVNLQRRLVDGGWLALLVLTVLGLHQLKRKRWRRRTRSLLLALALPGSFILLLGSARGIRTPAQPAFVPADQVAAYRYLARHAPRDAVVVASVATANPLPAWAPLRVPVGHGPESVNFAEVRREVESFYASRPGSVRQRLMVALQADYVLVGPQERSLSGGEFAAGESLVQEAQMGDYVIYRVERRQR